MTTPSDALQKATQISPALVEEIQDDPTILDKMTVGQRAVLQDRYVRRLLTDPEITPAQQLAGLSYLSESQRNALRASGSIGGGGSGVTINFIYGGGKKSVTIEGEAVTVPPDEPQDKLPNT